MEIGDIKTMKVMFINAVNYGSTGNIMFNIAEKVIENGGESLCTTGFTWHGKKPEYHFITSNIFTKYFHEKMSLITGNFGSYSKLATKKLIKKIEKFNPDIIHLHNLHGWFVNLPILFDYLKKSKSKIVWTFHDCWSFTGHCPHFSMINCNKWQTECMNCPQYTFYPQSLRDNSNKMFKRKREWFTGLSNLTIVTPSKWLSGLVKQSFLQDYPVKVINNGIDLEIFKHQESDFRKKYNIEDKKIILGVAFEWGERKGLDVFVELAKRLDDSYQVVLVGTDTYVRDLIRDTNIIAIDRTQNQKELAEIYSASDVFVNPTREENFPTVNIEALACGLPIVTFNTGGSPEIIDEKCGIVVDRDDIENMCLQIKNVSENSVLKRKDCINRAKQYDKKNMYDKYLKLYKKLLNENGD